MMTYDRNRNAITTGSNLSRLLRDVFTRPELPVLRTQQHLKLFFG